jgi:hypothetical protein
MAAARESSSKKEGILFVDPEKAFDRVAREVVSWELRKLRIK